MIPCCARKVYPVARGVDFGSVVICPTIEKSITMRVALEAIAKAAAELASS
jgi:hypothetical protein